MSDEHQMWARPLWRAKSLEEVWDFGDDIRGRGGIGGSPSIHLTQ